MKKAFIIGAVIILSVGAATGALSSESFQISDLTLSATPLVRLLPVTITVYADQEDLFYQFWVGDKYGSPDYPGGWVKLKEWSTENFCTWIPDQAGRYVLVVWVDDDLTETDDYEIIGLSAEVIAAGTVTVDITGSYSGTITVTERGIIETYGVDLTLNQTGTTLGGNWTTEEDESGTLSGTVITNSAATISLTQVQPCAGDFSGTMNIADGGNTLTGVYTGSYCEGTVRATFTLTRQ